MLTRQFPQGSDQSWLQKLSSYLEVSPLFEKPRLSNEAFVIQHFADKVKKLILKKHCCCVALKSFTGCCTFLCQQVEYQCRGFLEKNRDTLYEELVEVIRVSKVIFSVSLSCAEFPHGSSSFLLPSSVFQSPLLASFFQEEEDRNSANVRGVKVRPARPGMKPANKQLRASVGDKVCTSARCGSGSRSAASKTPLVFCRRVVLPLPLSADGDAERHHAALRPLHQAQ